VLLRLRELPGFGGPFVPQRLNLESVRDRESRREVSETYFLFQTLDLLVLGLDLLACLRLGRLQGHPQGLGLFFVQGGLLLRLGRSVRQLVSSPDC